MRKVNGDYTAASGVLQMQRSSRNLYLLTSRHTQWPILLYKFPPPPPTRWTDQHENKYNNNDDNRETETETEKKKWIVKKCFFFEINRSENALPRARARVKKKTKKKTKNGIVIVLCFTFVFHVFWDIVSYTRLFVSIRVLDARFLSIRFNTVSHDGVHSKKKRKVFFFF